MNEYEEGKWPPPPPKKKKKKKKKTTHLLTEFEAGRILKVLNKEMRTKAFVVNVYFPPWSIIIYIMTKL